MGNYNLKSKVLRCENCYSLLRMTIDPQLPESYIITKCRCKESKITLKDFLFEITKGSSYKVKCFNCDKEDKNICYCNECDHLYCSSCLKDHQKHRQISLSKLDFFCPYHQKEKFCSYCTDCSMNFCEKCMEGKKHHNHSILEFNKLTISKDERNFLKEKFKMVEKKMEFSTKFANSFAKKIKDDEQKKNLINAEKMNSAENKDILVVINFFMHFYDNSKHKNYSIIHNFTENINLNVNKFKIIDNESVEDTYKRLLTYFKKDFIIIRNGNDNDDDNLDDEKDIEVENNKKNEKKRTSSTWDIDENPLKMQQTVVGDRALAPIPNDMNFNRDSFGFGNNIDLQSYRIKNLQREMLANQVNNNADDDDFHPINLRPRSHAFFVHYKKGKQLNKPKALKEIKEETNTPLPKKEEKVEINKPTPKKEEKVENIKPLPKKEEVKIETIKPVPKKEEKIEKNINFVKKEEKVEKNVDFEKKPTKIEKKEEPPKEEKIVKKEEEKKVVQKVINKENKEIKVKTEENKYCKFIRLNRQRNKTNSIINQMMINGFKKSKIYKVNI